MLIVFKGFSVAKNYLRPYSAPLSFLLYLVKHILQAGFMNYLVFIKSEGWHGKFSIASLTLIEMDNVLSLQLEIALLRSFKIWILKVHCLLKFCILYVMWRWIMVTVYTVIKNLEYLSCNLDVKHYLHKTLRPQFSSVSNQKYR